MGITQKFDGKLFFSLCLSYITFNSLIHFRMVWHLSWDLSFLLVRICNCTKLGYCYMEPEAHSWKLGMSSTIGILAGIFGFISKTDMLELVLLRLYLNIKTSKLSLNFFSSSVPGHCCLPNQEEESEESSSWWRDWE